ncbi:uncharacterized protein LOC123015569 isoform X1 [Tribolium madens]|uniref:uncharacterized protein LOC123015569 isoform X1 n=1 Tax=Tribolium madens TaxID=41895 RepID=UPI001CF743D2|nr:uncharacterized protein LOC123015569 isoform X1 [Tribolium madens]
MLKNSYGQLASQFDILRKENGYLLARLQNAVNNGNPNVVSNVLRRLTQANQQYNVFRNAMQADNFNLQKTLQYSMLQLQDRDRALNNQNIQIKNLQQIIRSLPIQCRNFALSGNNFETNDCSNLSVDNKKMADLIKTKEGEVQNLRKQISSLLVEYSNLKSPNNICIQKPCLCAEAQHHVKKVQQIVTPTPPKIVRVLVPVVQPKVVVKEVKVPQIGGQRCPPPRIEKIEVPKVIIQKVPFEVPVPSKCTLPDLSTLYNCKSLEKSIDELSLPNFSLADIFKFKQTLLSLITRQKNCMASSITTKICTNLPKINVPQSCLAPSSIVDSLVMSGYSTSVVTSYKESLLLLLQNVQNCSLQGKNYAGIQQTKVDKLSGANCPKLPVLKLSEGCFEPVEIVNSVDLGGYSPSDSDNYKQSLLKMLNKLQKCTLNLHSVSGFSSIPPALSNNNLQNNCSHLRLPLLEAPQTCLSPSQYTQNLVIQGYNPTDISLFKQSLLGLIEKLQNCRDSPNYSQKAVSNGGLLLTQQPPQSTCGNLPKLPTVGNCVAPPEIINQVNLNSFSKLEAEIFKQTLLELLHLQQKCCSKQTSQVVEKPVYVRIPVELPPRTVVKKVQTVQPPRIIVKQVPVPVLQPPQIITKQVYVPASTKCKPIIQQVPVKYAVPVKIKIPVRIPVTKPCHLPNIDIFDCSPFTRAVDSLDLSGYNPSDVSEFKESLLSLINKQRMCSLTVPTSASIINPYISSNNQPKVSLGTSRCNLPDLSQLQGCITPQMLESFRISPVCSHHEVLTFKQTLLGIAAVQRNCVMRNDNPPPMSSDDLQDELPRKQLQSIHQHENKTPKPNGVSPNLFTKQLVPKVIVKEIRVPVKVPVPVRVMQPPRILVKQVPVPILQPPKIIIKQVPILINKTNSKPLIIYKEKPVMVQLPPRVLIKQVPVKVFVPVQAKVSTDCHLPSININSCSDLQNEINSLVVGGFNSEEVNSFKQNLYSVLMQQRNCIQCHLPDVNIQGCEAFDQQIGSMNIPGYNQWDVEIFKQKLISILAQQKQCLASTNGGDQESKAPQPYRVIAKQEPIPVPQTAKIIYKQIPVFTKCDKKPVIIVKEKPVPILPTPRVIVKQVPIRVGDDGTKRQQPGTTKLHSSELKCHLPSINIQGCADLIQQINLADMSSYDSLEVLNFKRNLLSMFLEQRKCIQKSVPNGPTTHQPVYIRVPVKVPVRVEVPKEVIREVKVPVPVLQPPRIIIKQVPVQVPQSPRVIIKQIPIMTKCDHKPNVVVQEKPVQIPSPPRIVIKQVPVRVPVSTNLRCHLPRLNINNCEDLRNVVGSLSVPDYDGFEVNRFKKDILLLLNKQRNCIKCKLPDLQVIAGCHALQNQIQSLPLSNFNSWDVHMFKQNLLSLLDGQRKCVLQSGSLVRNNIVPEGEHGETINPGIVPSCVPKIVEVPKEVVKEVIKEIRVPVKQPVEVPKEVKVFVPQAPRILIKQVEVPVPQPPKVIVKEVPVINENCDQQPKIIVKEKPVHIPVPGRTITKEVPVRVNVPVRIPVKSECHLPVVNVNTCNDIQSEIDSIVLNGYNLVEVNNFKQKLFSSFMQQRNCLQCRLPQVNVVGCEDLQKQVDSINIQNYSSLDIANFKENLFNMLLNQRKCMQKQLERFISPNQGLKRLPGHTILSTASDEYPRITAQPCVPKEIIKEVKVPVKVFVKEPPKIVIKKVSIPQPPRIIIKQVPTVKYERNQIRNGGAVPEITPSAPSNEQSGVPKCVPKEIIKVVKVPVKVFVSQPPKIVTKEIPVPRILIKQVPVLKCDYNQIRKEEEVPGQNSAYGYINKGSPNSLPYSNYDSVFLKRNVCEDLQNEINSLVLPVPDSPQIPDFKQKLVSFILQQRKCGQCRLPSLGIGGCQNLQNQVASLNMPNYVSSEVQTFKNNLLNLLLQQRNCVKSDCEAKVIKVPVDRFIYHRVPVKIPVKEIVEVPKKVIVPVKVPIIKQVPVRVPVKQIVEVPKEVIKEIVKEVRVPVKEVVEVPKEVIKKVSIMVPQQPKVVVKQVPVAVRQPPKVIIKQVLVPTKCDHKPNVIVKEKPVQVPVYSPPIVKQVPVKILVKSECHLPQIDFSNLDTCGDVHSLLGSLAIPGYSLKEVDRFKEKLLAVFAQQRNCAQCRLPDIDINQCGGLQHQVDSLNIQNSNLWEVQTFKHKLLTVLLNQRNCVVQPECRPQVIKVPVDRPVYREIPVNIPVKQIIEVPKEIIREIKVPVYKQVPVRVPVKQIVEVPKDVIKEVKVEVPKEVIKVVKVPVRVPILQPPKVLVREVTVPVPQPPKIIVKQVPIIISKCTQKPRIVVKEKPVPIQLPPRIIIKEVPVKVKVSVPVGEKNECHLPTIKLNSCEDIQNQIASLVISGYSVQEVQQFKQNLLSVLFGQRNCLQCHLPDISVYGCTGLENQIAAIHLPNLNALEAHRFKHNLFTMLLKQQQCGPRREYYPEVLQFSPPKTASLISEDLNPNVIYGNGGARNLNIPEMKKEACKPRVLVKEVPISVPRAPKVIVKQVPVITKCDQKPQIIIREKPVPVPSAPRIVIKEVPVSSKCYLPKINVATCDKIQSQIENLEIPNYSSLEVTQFKQNLLTILTRQKSCTLHHCARKECHLPNINIKGCSYLENQIGVLSFPDFNPGEVQTFKQNLLSLLLQQQNCQKNGSLNKRVPVNVSTEPQKVVVPQVPFPQSPNIENHQRPQQGNVPLPSNAHVNRAGEGSQLPLQDGVPKLHKAAQEGGTPMYPREGASGFPTLTPFSFDYCRLPDLSLSNCEDLESQVRELFVPKCNTADVFKFKQGLFLLLAQHKICNKEINPLRENSSGTPSSLRLPTNYQNSCRLPRIDLHGCTNLQNKIESLNLNNYDLVSVAEFKQNLLSVLLDQRRCISSGSENCQPKIVKVPVEIRVPYPVPQAPKIIVKQVPVFIKQNPEIVIKYVPVHASPKNVVLKHVPVRVPVKVPVREQVPVRVPIPVQVPVKPEITDTPVYIQKPVVTKEVPVNLCPKPQIIIKEIPVEKKVFVPQSCNSESDDNNNNNKILMPQSVKPIIKQIPAPVKEPLKVLVKKVPVYIKTPVPVRIPQLKIVEKQVPVRIEVPPKVIIKEVKVPMLNGKSCPPPKVVMEKVPVPQPPQIITKPVLVSVPCNSSKLSQMCALPTLPLPKICESPENVVNGIFLGGFGSNDFELFKQNLLQLLKHQQHCNFSPKAAQLDAAKFPSKSFLCQTNRERLMKRLHNYGSQLCRYKKMMKQLQLRFNGLLNLRQEQLPAVPLPMLHVMKSVSPSVPLRPFQHVSSVSATRATFVRNLNQVYKHTQAALQHCMDAILAQSLTHSQINAKCNNCHQLIQDKELAENQIKFLNSIIVDMQKKTEEQRARIEILESGYSPAMADELKLMGSIQRQVPPRIYCDICEEFDLHETEDCPKQNTDLVPANGGQREHKHVAERPYCEICEAFGHATEDCQEDQTF